MRLALIRGGFGDGCAVTWRSLPFSLVLSLVARLLVAARVLLLLLAIVFASTSFRILLSVSIFAVSALPLTLSFAPLIALVVLLSISFLEFVLASAAIICLVVPMLISIFMRGLLLLEFGLVFGVRFGLSPLFFGVSPADPSILVVPTLRTSVVLLPILRLG